MTLFGIATEKFVLRKLVNQPPIALFMATIGLAFFIEGVAPRCDYLIVTEDGWEAPGDEARGWNRPRCRSRRR